MYLCRGCSSVERISLQSLQFRYASPCNCCETNFQKTNPKFKDSLNANLFLLWSGDHKKTKITWSRRKFCARKMKKVFHFREVSKFLQFKTTIIPFSVCKWLHRFFYDYILSMRIFPTEKNAVFKIEMWRKISFISRQYQQCNLNIFPLSLFAKHSSL